MPTCTNIALPLCCPLEVSPDDGGYLSPADSVTAGPRHSRFFNTTPATTVYLTWDMVDDVTASYLYIGNLLLQTVGNLLEIRLRGSADNISYTTEHSITVFNYVGPYKNDIFETFAETSAYRYWRVEFIFSAFDTLNISKIYFGNPLDIGIEPDSDIQEVRLDRDALNYYRTTNANAFGFRVEDIFYQLTISYSGLDVTTADTLLKTFSYLRNTYVLLYNESYPELLNNHTVLHGLVSGVSLRQTSEGLYELDLIFTELTG